MKVAIVYDRVNKWGGAERVLLALNKIFPEAPLYTSVYDSKNAPWAKVFPQIKTSFLQGIPLARFNHEFLAALMPLAFESFDFSHYDLVISVTSEAAKGIKTGPSTVHVCYCLTPTRYLWSHYDEYFQNPILKFFSKPIVNYLKKWDKIAAKRPDAIIGISSEVKKRINKHYGLDAETIFPPVDMPRIKHKKTKGKYFLIVSRLVGYKKVDLAVRAFNKLKIPLVVIGRGREKEKLKNLAKNNIKFIEDVNEQELMNYYLGARALIMPQEEDFGLVSLEAQGCGVPVIAFRKGGVLDTVIEGKTGMFFLEQTVGSLSQAVKKFIYFEKEVKKSDLYNQASMFGFDRFKKELLEIVKKMVD